MNSKAFSILYLAALALSACAGPERRHEARVSRREDAAERVETRATTRQDVRYDRRADRYERAEQRFGY